MLSVCGTIDLDLGRATLHGAETVVHVRNVFGTVTILVPRGVHVPSTAAARSARARSTSRTLARSATPRACGSSPPGWAGPCA